MLKLLLRSTWPRVSKEIELKSDVTVRDAVHIASETLDIEFAALAKYDVSCVKYVQDVLELRGDGLGSKLTLAEAGVSDRSTILFEAPADLKPPVNFGLRQTLRVDRDDAHLSDAEKRKRQYGMFTVENVLGAFARSKGVMRESASVFIDVHAHTTLYTKAFLDLQQAQVISLIRRDTLNISEVRLFTCVCRWVAEQVKNEKMHSMENANNNLALPSNGLLLTRQATEKFDDDFGIAADAQDLERMKELALPLLRFIRFPQMSSTELSLIVVPSRIVPQDHCFKLLVYANEDKPEHYQLDMPYINRPREGREPWLAFTFDSKHAHPSVDVQRYTAPEGDVPAANTDTQISFGSATSAAALGAFGTEALDAGRHTYDVTFLKMPRKGVEVRLGFRPSAFKGFDCKGHIGDAVPGYALISSGEKVHGGESKKLIKGIEEGDVVRVILDFDKRTILFAINGEAAQTAFVNIKARTLRPAITAKGIDVVLKISHPRT
jgi:hypothetical protein